MTATLALVVDMLRRWNRERERGEAKTAEAVRKGEEEVRKGEKR